LASLISADIPALRASTILHPPTTNLDLADSNIGEYIIFTIDEQEYGLKITNVRDIRGWTQESKIPNLPLDIRGMINLRGAVILIVDLRIRFGGTRTQATPTHVVIIVGSNHDLRGILVDAISDIVLISHHEIKHAPEILHNALNSGYIDSLYTPEDRMIALLGPSAYRTSSLINDASALPPKRSES
jgi:purine-binding chemotaxis protein CheW